MTNLVPEPEIGDAFGEALLAKLDGEEWDVIYERDDGLVNSDSGNYFLPVGEWEELGRWCLDRTRGRVLDVGAGGGRACLALQDRGQTVVGLDVSPGAAEACRRRGVRETFGGDIHALALDPKQKFDTFLLLGNNLGLVGTPEHAARWFDAFTALANPGATIVGTCLDPTLGEAPTWHASYHERNRQAGRMPGEIKLRTRFRNITTDWFDLLWMSPEELDELATQSGWKITQVKPGPLYGAVLVRMD